MGIPNSEINASNLTSGDDGTDEPRSSNVVARRQSKNVPRTSQQKSTQDHAVQPRNSHTRQSNDSCIKAGVDIVRKSVVHIDNLDANCTPASLRPTDYLLANDISVLSCYATKSWTRNDEKERVTAYWVRLKADERRQILDTNL